MTGDKAGRGTDLLLAVKGVKESSVDLPRRGRQVIEPLAYKLRDAVNSEI